MSDFDPSTIVVPDPADWVPEAIRNDWSDVVYDDRDGQSMEVLEWVLFGDKDSEQLPDESPEDRYRDLLIWQGKRKPQWWVNVYTVHQEYGGPEEGGWHYNVHVPHRTLPPLGPMEDYVKACELSARIKETHKLFEEGEDGYSIVERYPARVSPLHRPHYC